MMDVKDRATSPAGALVAASTYGLHCQIQSSRQPALGDLRDGHVQPKYNLPNQASNKLLISLTKDFLI